MKYVFITGVAGSCWGWPVTYLQVASNIIDCSNKKPWRANTNIPCAATHRDNVYAGPYNEIGEMFDQLSLYYKKQHIFDEIDRAYEPTTEHKLRIVNCHWFSYQLDWIAENLPEVDIILNLRNVEMAHNGWLKSGGWNIEYPSYKWYNNTQNLWRQSQIEHKLMQKFVKKHDIKVNSGWNADWFDINWPEVAPFIDKSKFQEKISSTVGQPGAPPIHVGYESLNWAFYKGKKSTSIEIENI